jgi:molybdate transport system substrate-binding protein
LYTLRNLALTALLLSMSADIRAEEILVAVARNFGMPFGEIIEQFREQTGHDVLVSAGSTGKHYANIVNGAPYDVFLSADVRRAELLEANALIVPGSRFTYAIGQLLLWSRDEQMADGDCMRWLEDLGDKKLAIANPMLAPYGAAAKQFLVSKGLWDDLQSNLVYGEHVAVAFHYAVSGNASMAIIARSLWLGVQSAAVTCAVLIPGDTHDPIQQQAVQLNGPGSPQVVRQFMEYLRGPDARRIIEAHGYLLPDQP